MQVLALGNGDRMELTKHKKLSGLCWLTVLLVLVPAQVCGQKQKLPEGQEVLQTLLNEVRQLRQSLQRSILNANLSQIFVERLRIQTERVNTLTRTLEDTRGRHEEVQQEISLLTKRVKELEGVIQRTSDASQLEQFEDEHKAIQLSLENGKARAQRLQERETAQEQQLRVEQAKQDELENRVDGIVRDLQNELDRVKSDNKRLQEQR
jgi:DNA repair exonuclease SbcCD ATPase subunit